MKYVTVSIVTSIVITGCSIHVSPNEDAAKMDCSKIIKTFYKLSDNKQISAFGSYNVEQQYEIYICGNQKVHPPAIYLAWLFSREGETIVEFLRKKLEAAHGDMTIYNIILVYNYMNRDKIYNVADNSELMLSIETAAKRVEDDFFRGMSEQAVNQIRTVHSDCDE